MPLKIGDQEFKSKESAKKFIREKFKDFDGADPFWFYLLDRHPSKKEKIGPGVKEFILGFNPINSDAFQLSIRRIDGSFDHFSWLKCLDAKEKTAKANLLTAMRLAIAPQTQAYKDKCADKMCQLCGKELLIRFDRNVDHYPITFKELSSNFLLTEPNPPQEFADCPRSNAAKFKEDDSDFEKRWFIYHLENAKYRILCQSCNNKSYASNIKK